MALVNWFNQYERKFGYRWYFPELLYRLADLKVLTDFKSVLGVGSGRAFTENMLARNGYVIASDTNTQLVHIAKKHAQKVVFLACNGFNLPFQDQSFACVYSQGLLEHFGAQSANKLLKEMGRVGETVVFSVPLDSCRASPLGIEYRRKPSEWRRILSDIFGFAVVLFYFNGEEAVFVASDKPLQGKTDFSATKALKRILWPPISE